MGLQISFHEMGRARVMDQDVDDVFAWFAALVDLDGGQSQPFARNVRACKGLATRSAAAQIHPVPATHRESKQLTFEINWGQEGHVINVRAALVRIVHADHISFEDILESELLDNGFGRELHRRQVDGTVRGLTQQLAFVVINCVGEIDHIGEDGRKRRPLQHRRHAIAGVLENAAQYFKCDWIHLGLLDDRRI